MIGDDLPAQHRDASGVHQDHAATHLAAPLGGPALAAGTEAALHQTADHRANAAGHLVEHRGTAGRLVVGDDLIGADREAVPVDNAALRCAANDQLIAAELDANPACTHRWPTGQLRLGRGHHAQAQGRR